MLKTAIHTQSGADSLLSVTYPVMEHFYTLQGEGMYAGQAAYFIRLGGCDVGCVWCDVKESWDAEVHPKVSVKELVTAAMQYPGRIAVITGGEPAMHNLTALTESLRLKGFKTHIETSGSSALTGTWDWITLSPKKFKAPLSSVVKVADELKVVVYNKSDFRWAEEFALQVSLDCKLFLQPEWGKCNIVSPLIVDYIKQYPRWQMSIQTHKYLNIP